MYTQRNHNMAGGRSASTNKHHHPVTIELYETGIILVHTLVSHQTLGPLRTLFQQSIP